MNEKATAHSPPGLTVGDIYYVIFRHKWKIALISAVGIIVAFILPYVVPRPYASEAEIFIRYVVETKTPGGVSVGDSRVKSADEGGASVLSSEIEILTSLDLAEQVAGTIGPEKILAKAGGGKDTNSAAALIRGNLFLSVPNRSSVVTLRFQHPDPAVVQPVLRELVEAYFQRHADIHRSVGMFDSFLTDETDKLRSKLMQTERELQRAKTNAGIISLEDTKKSYSDQLSRIRLDINAAEAERAEREGMVDEMAKILNLSASPTNAAGGGSVKIINEKPIPPEKIVEFKRLSYLIDSLTKRELELSMQFTPSNSLVQSTRERISTAEALKGKLVEEFPGLLGVGTSQADPIAGLKVSLKTELARLIALGYRIRALTNQLVQIRQEATSITSIEGAIVELQRRRALEEANFNYFAANLFQAEIDEALGAGRNSNIKRIQAPTPPYRDNSRLNKMMKMAAFGSIAAALALAFLIEMFVDRSIRRPSEIQTHLKLPLFLTIPRLSLNGKTRGLKALRKQALLKAGTAAGDQPDPAQRDRGTSKDHTLPDSPVEAEFVSHREGIAPWDERHTMRPFFETLRDRLIVFFEAIDLTHKPKLVAVTSCGQGAGVTTTAAGLAACLSETGEGNVLLVDMNLRQGEAHRFYKGNLKCGLDDVLEGGKRDDALVRENLYVVAEGKNDSQLPQFLPKRFKHLVPRLRASDYDYIIFDMPPVTQISPTPRLARFMDMVFLVVESEKTDRDVVKRATALLSESKANIGVILNKSKPYVPKRLQHDI